jgi:replicative DNA helicase
VNREQQTTVPVPYDKKAEESVIGSLLIDRDAIIALAPVLQPADFHFEQYRLVYEAVSNLYAQRVPADLVTLQAELARMGVEDALKVALDALGWANKTPTASHAMYYARLVREHAVRRALITTGGNIAALGYERDRPVKDVLEQAQAALASVYDRTHTREYSTSEQVMDAYMDRLDRGQVAGVPTGFSVLDHITGGLQPGALVVLAGRPGQGKTTLALNIAYNAMLQGHRVGIFSLEMTEMELADKWVSLASRLSSERLRPGKVTDADYTRLADVVPRVSSLPFCIDEATSLSITDLRARATRMHAREPLALLIVDYLQLVSGSARKEANRTQEVGEVARGLKLLAMDLDIPVLACCQLNRMIEQRNDKTPQLSDLRESGEIEQAANVAMFLHREDDESTEAALYIRKHRGGKTGKVMLYCDLATSRFADLARFGEDLAA